MIDTDIELLKGIANQLRIHSIQATTAAGSGHPTSCCSAADLVATLDVLHPAERETRDAIAVRWMVEELRVNLFAQNLGTKYPVSPTRIHKALTTLLTAP